MRFWEVGDLTLQLVLTGLGLGMVLGLVIYFGVQVVRHK